MPLGRQGIQAADIGQVSHPLACHVQDRAVELGLNHGKRLHLRERLKAARLTCPLFDTVTWVKDLEKVLFKMWSIHCEGSGPRCFEVR